LPTRESNNGKPYVVGHRGYSGKYPENTMLSIEEAIKNGADAFESDIRETADGEVVMLHDPSLDRTTNGSGLVKDVNWYGYLEDLKTIKEPPQAVARFKDVLELLTRPDVVAKKIWFLIDIKLDNSPDILKSVRAIIESFPSHDFSRQIVLGIWHPKFLEPVNKLLPDFATSFIGVSVPAARKHFFDHVDSFNLNFASLVGSDGQSFIREAHAAQKPVYVWTVNSVGMMRESEAWGVDAILGDNVELMCDVIKETDDGKLSVLLSSEGQRPFMTLPRVLYFSFFRHVMRLFSWYRLGV